MSNITDTQWRYFIKLTLVNSGAEGSFDGYIALDVNQKVTLIWDETNKCTRIIFCDGRASAIVKETPDEIVTMVDARIEEEKEKRKAEHEAVMAAYGATEEKE